jgi:hypothetical protein
VRSRDTEKLSFADEVATKPLVAQSAKPTTQPINVLLKELRRMDQKLVENNVFTFNFERQKKPTSRKLSTDKEPAKLILNET